MTTRRITRTGIALGALAAATVLGGGVASASPSPLTVNGTDDIFYAGQTATPPTTNGGEGTLPSSTPVNPGDSLSVTVLSGSVFFCGGATPPTGTANCTGDGSGGNYFGTGSNVSDPNGLLGSYTDPTVQVPLVGVFEASAPPAAQQPALASQPHSGTVTPGLGQVFYLGNGTSGPTVVVPAGATQLYLGFADAQGFAGTAGYYSDNGGSLTVAVTPQSPTTALPEAPITVGLPLAFLGIAGGSAALLRRRRSTPAS